MLTTIGLVIICTAWVYQMVRILRGGTALYAIFLVLYALGVALLVIDGIMGGAGIATYLNLVAGLAAVITLVSLGRHP